VGDQPCRAFFFADVESSLCRCVSNADKTVTIYTGSNDHHVYKLSADAQKVLRGTS
jgi:hypothetical protein